MCVQKQGRRRRCWGRSLTAEPPSRLRRCWSRGGGQLWASFRPSAHWRGEEKEEEEQPLLYSSISRMEVSRASSSSCNCFSSTSRRRKQGVAERPEQSSHSDQSFLQKPPGVGGGTLSWFWSGRGYLEGPLRSGCCSAPSSAGWPERQTPRGGAARGQGLPSQPIGCRLQPGSRPKRRNHGAETPPPAPPPPPPLLERPGLQPELVRLRRTSRTERLVYLSEGE